jgi:hypothetical protein
LTLSGGRKLKYVNELDCDAGPDHCVHYFLVDFQPGEEMFILRQDFYEGGQALLIDRRTGKQTVLDALPYVSPNGTRYFVFDDDFENSTEWPMQIWRRTSTGVTLEWQSPPVLGLVADRGSNWTSDSKIKLRLHFLDPEHDGTADVVLTPSGWSLTIQKLPEARAKQPPQKR